MVCSFMISDNIYEYISNMGNNLSPYSIATGEENYYLLAPNLPFEKLELCKIHSNYNYDNDDDIN